MRAITAGMVLCCAVGLAGAAGTQNNPEAEIDLERAKNWLKTSEDIHGKHTIETTTAIDNLAETYASQGHHQEAEVFLKRALAIREEVLGQDHEDTAASIRKLVWLYESSRQYVQAGSLQERLVAIDRKIFGDHDPRTLDGISHLALLYVQQGDHAGAEPLFRQALAGEETFGTDDWRTIVKLNLLGACLLNRGTSRVDEAEQLFKRALGIGEKIYGPDHPRTALSLCNLAILYDFRGQPAEAEQLIKRATAIREKALGPNHPDTADSLDLLVALYMRQGKYAEAEPICQRKLAVAEKSLDTDPDQVAESLDNLARLYRLQGKCDHAEQLLKRALAMAQKDLPDHPNTAVLLTSLAILYASQNKYAEAEPLYRRALAIDEKALGPDHQYTASIRNNLAGLQVGLGCFPEAAGLIDQSRRSTRRHVARVLPLLAAAEQVMFLRTQDEGSFHGALTLGLLQKSMPRIASLSAGWLANGKAVAQEAASQRIILARQSENPAMKAAVGSLERVRANVARLSQMMPSPTEAAAYRAKLTELQAEEHRLVREIGGQLATLDRDEPWVEIDDIRRKIPAGNVLVDIARFGIFDFQAVGQGKQVWPARYAAWIVPPAGKGDVTILDLGPADEIDAAVAAYREAIEAVQKGGFKRGQATAEEELKVTAAPLTQKVLQPIADAVGDATEVILAPDGDLWLVPWQALPLADGSYAIEKFAIRTVTSARDLVPVPVEAKGGTGGSVVAADPAFDAAPAASGTSSADATRSFAPASGIERRFPRLPGTRVEVSATKPALATLKGGEPTILLGADASETNIKRSAVRPAALVLATHGFFKPDQVAKKDDKAATQLAGTGSRGMTRAVTTTGEPLEDPLLRCGLALAGANVGAKATGADDGILTGAEIVGLDLLGTELVVLSACETGVGTVRNGEGVAGLRQAFQIAGAKSVVATLWQVPDAESAQIMQSFYANVAQGQPSSQALRAAQLAFIKARREDRTYEAAHPYLWAAYGVTGR